MDFLDLAQKYATARFDQATQPFTDTEGYMEDRFGNVKPKSTTINYNDDGSSTITTKHEVGTPQQPAQQQQPQFNIGQPPVSEAPASPMPVSQVPQPQPQAQPAPQVTPMPQQAPQMQPAVQQAPQQQPAPQGLWNDYQDQSQLPPEQRMPQQAPQQMPQPAPQAMPQPQQQPAPQMQPAVQQPAAPAAPVAPQPVGQTVNAAPTPQPQAQPAPQAQPTPQQQPMSWSDELVMIQNDPTKLAAYVGNDKNPEEARKIASQMWQVQLQKKDDQLKAEKVITAAVQGDPKAQNQLVRDLRKQSDEGSYVKAYLFQRLGLHDLSKEEQQKLGAGTSWQSLIGQDGQRYTAEVGGQGNISRAYDDQGNMVSDKTLAQLSAQGIPMKGNVGHAGATRVRDSSGKEWSVVPTTRGSIFYDNSGAQGTPQGKTVPITAGSDWVGQYALQHNKTVSEYIAKHGVDAVMKEGGQWMNPVTGEMSNVAKGGYNPYAAGGLPQGGMQAPQQMPPQPAPAARARPMSMQQGPVAPGEMPTAQPAVAQAQPQPQGMWNDYQDQSLLPPEQRMPQPGMQPAVGQMPEAGGFMKTGLSNLDVRQKLEQKSGETGIEVGGARSKKYNEYLDENVAPDAKNGYEISQLRKKQFGLFNRPGVNADQIFGLYNAAGEKPNDQKLAIIRDIIGGTFKDQVEVSKRLAELNLDPATRSALEEYNILNADINRRTLKATAGAGSVSDAEQDANRKSNVDPGKIPALGGYNAIAQSQFNGDLATYKGDWAADQKFSNTLQLERAWRKESAKMADIYKKVAEERIKYINDNGNSTAAVREGYKRFPVPEYDPATGTWKKTKPLNQIFGR